MTAWESQLVLGNGQHVLTGCLRSDTARTIHSGYLIHGRLKSA